MRAVGNAARAMRLPVWSPQMPRPQRRPRPPRGGTGADRTVVYFPSCVARTLGPSRGAPDERGVIDALLSVLDKAGYGAVFPEGLDGLCCGMAFDSKGFPEAARRKSEELAAALERASDAGNLPILCDTSPCVYTMARRLALRIYEPIEFIHTFLMDRLRFEKVPETVALHPPCSTDKMGLTERMVTLARACAQTVVVPSGVTCCGFAGDKGFTLPELNRSALAHLAEAIPSGCARGYSNSRTCEVGLSQYAGIPYQSIVHLVDRSAASATVARPGPVPRKDFANPPAGAPRAGTSVAPSERR
jgi:D-lactate dehydrogenase